MRALIIENSETDQLLISSVFDSLGVEIEFVGTAANCFQRLDDEEFDLVCLNMYFSDTSGFDFCRRLRSQDSTRLMPIILLTSEADDNLLKEDFHAGVTEIIQKSNVEEFRHSLSEFLSRINQIYVGRVLLFEESAATTQSMQPMMEKMHLDVDRLTNAEDALESFVKVDYDLAIVDIAFDSPMHGLGLVRAMRKSAGARGRVPILVVSVLDDPAHKIEILRFGANDSVSKPIIEEELSARIGNLIISKQLRDKVREQAEKLQALSITDQVTGLYNRRYLASSAAQFVSNAKRHAEPLCLMKIDLDHFKAINDAHGHEAGDVVLEAVGNLLKSACRSGDIAARFDGEEFVLVLAHCDMEAARDKAEIIRQDIEAMNPGGINITASIGVAELALDQDQDFMDLFRAADAAVYQAKEAGRNRVRVDGEGTSGLRSRIGLL